MSDPRPPDSGTPGETDIAEPNVEELGVSRTRGSVFFIVARAVSALFNLVSVPILLSLLGKEAYGAIVFALVIQNLMACFDLGTTEIAIRQMSMAIAARDDLEFQELNRDQLSINLLSGAVMILVGLLCAFFIRLDGSGMGFAETFAIFLGIGIQSAINRLSLSVITPLAAYQKFDRISLGVALGGVATTAVAIALAYFTRRPWTYAIAIIAGETLTLFVLSRAAKRFGKWRFPSPTFRKERLLPMFRLCLVDYPNRIGAFFSAAGDKLMLGAAGPIARLHLVDYRNGSRLPDVLKEMLLVFGTTSLPNFSRDLHHSPKRFQVGVLFSGTVAFFACCLAMLVPAGFADPLLRLWLGRYYAPEGATVFLLMAVFQALQTYVLVMGFAFFAMAKRGWFIPITLGGAAVTLILTLPIYRSYGIEGVAAMNAVLGGAQALGLWIILAKLGFPGEDVLRHGFRILGIMAVCFAFTALGLWVSSTPLLKDIPALALIFAPISVLLAMGAVIVTRLAVLPDRLSRRLGMIWPFSIERAAGPD